jgi:hypothetical protein
MEADLSSAGATLPDSGLLGSEEEEAVCSFLESRPTTSSVAATVAPTSSIPIVANFQ